MLDSGDEDTSGLRRHVRHRWLFDPEFALWSNGLMEDFRTGRFIPALSDWRAAEVTRAPERVQEMHRELLGLVWHEDISISTDVLDLLGAYEAHSVLGPRYRADMLHIALATFAEVDLLVSWNFKHIVRFDKIRLFNAVNLEQGYKPLVIHSPREVTTYGRSSYPGD
jgi:hypothetical protein